MKANDIISITTGVTKKWAKQRKAEERSSRARSNRQDRMTSNRVNQTDVSDEEMASAYLAASSGGTLPAKARQIFYRARGPIQERTGRPLDSVYFTQTLLPRYLRKHPDTTAKWKIAYDARGGFLEPHTGEEIRLGTLEVDGYLRAAAGHKPTGVVISGVSCAFPTVGTAHRISAVLFIEKEGFNQLFQAVKLAERYDLAIMSTKGQSVVAARRLVDELCSAGVPLLILHDFDKEGFNIAQTLTSVSAAAEEGNRVRYVFRNQVNVIDLGLRLADVKKWKLESETVQFKGGFGFDTQATKAEQEFLRANQRVELNAFTSGDFIEWIEGKLAEYGIKKLVPDDDTLEHAYRRAYQIAAINADINRIKRRTRKLAMQATVPKGLAAAIRKRLKSDPSQPWDIALAEVAETDFVKSRGV